MNQTIPLSALEEGQEAFVGALRANGPIRRRLRDLGLTDGARVVCLQKSPCGDPAAYLIRGRGDCAAAAGRRNHPDERGERTWG